MKKIEPKKGIDVYNLAEEFHRVYEEESRQVGWKTQEDCRVPFKELPETNQMVMLRTCARMIKWIGENIEKV